MDEHRHQWSVVEFYVERDGADVDRAKAFYVDQVGLNADHDIAVNENLRFEQSG